MGGGQHGTGGPMSCLHGGTSLNLPLPATAQKLPSHCSIGGSRPTTENSAAADDDKQLYTSFAVAEIYLLISDYVFEHALHVI
jgi:hypothetical protein